MIEDSDLTLGAFSEYASSDLTMGQVPGDPSMFTKSAKRETAPMTEHPFYGNDLTMGQVPTIAPMSKWDLLKATAIADIQAGKGFSVSGGYARQVDAFLTAAKECFGALANEVNHGSAEQKTANAKALVKYWLVLGDYVDQGDVSEEVNAAMSDLQENVKAYAGSLMAGTADTKGETVEDAEMYLEEVLRSGKNLKEVFGRGKSNLKRNVIVGGVAALGIYMIATSARPRR